MLGRTGWRNVAKPIDPRRPHGHGDGTRRPPRRSKRFACGFHDDVTLARGIMNWVYPDALHVVGAISSSGRGRTAFPTAMARWVRICSEPAIARR